MGVLELRPGGILPLHAGAAGRVALAFGSVDLDTYLDGAPFPHLTPRTIVDAEALREDVSTARAQGYVISDEDVTIGVTSIGVPIIHKGRFFGALSFGALKGEVLSGRHEHLDIMRSAAEDLVATAPVEPAAARARLDSAFRRHRSTAGAGPAKGTKHA